MCGKEDIHDRVYLGGLADRFRTNARAVVRVAEDRMRATLKLAVGTVVIAMVV